MISDKTNKQFICCIWKISYRMEKFYWYIGKWLGPDDQIFHFYIYISWVSFTQQLLWRKGLFARIFPGLYKKKSKKQNKKKPHQTHRKIIWNEFGHEKADWASLLLKSKKRSLKAYSSKKSPCFLVFSVSVS